MTGLERQAMHDALRQYEVYCRDRRLPLDADDELIDELAALIKAALEVDFEMTEGEIQ